MRETGGTIYGADTYAAYKLLESFVQHIEYCHQQADVGATYIDKLERRCELQVGLNKKAATNIEELSKALADALVDSGQWREKYTNMVDEADNLRESFNAQRHARSEEGRKAERILQAVVYAYEGREVPNELKDNGMVQRALFFKAGVVLTPPIQDLLASECVCRTAGCGHKAHDHLGGGFCRICKVRCWS